MLKPVEPIYTVELFPPLNDELLALLRGLPAADWDAPTACGDWNVQNVTAHLLGGSLGRLSARRARSAGGDEPGFDELLEIINRANADWVSAARRIPPALLIAFLEITEPRLYTQFKSWPPFESSGPAVAWAGDHRSPNWFDIAREYTEKWLHQQHIREAVGAPLLTGRRWLHPVFDTFLRALPYTYRDTHAAPGAAVTLQISGEAGDAWSLRRNARGSGWQLFAGVDPAALACLTLDADTAWRLFTRSIAPEAAQSAVEIQGDPAIGLQALKMVSIMA